jgi:hypothetical protein
VIIHDSPVNVRQCGRVADLRQVRLARPSTRSAIAAAIGEVGGEVLVGEDLALGDRVGVVALSAAAPPARSATRLDIDVRTEHGAAGSA